MLRRLPLALLALPAPLLAAPLPSQEPAKASLYMRTADGIVRAAIQIELDGAWHIYHEELGHPKAVGQPTTVTFLGEGINWSKVRFPQPVRLDQSAVAGAGTFILAHEHELVLYAAGKLAEGASADGLQVKLKALVCEDIQGCIPFRKTLESEGAGEDALFAAFPADLVASLGGGPVASATSEPVADPLVPTLALAGDGAPREDEIESGEADTTLY